ncbi:MAG: urease accessory protein UreF [Bacteroides sp.]|nr:urease accessory protein UreF [Bacteroides sp.]
MQQPLPLFMLMQLTDSALPVGTFSFSNGLETAAHLGLVHDADTLTAFARTVSLQAAYTDGIAALEAHRAARADDFPALCRIDHRLLQCKLNEESRLMLCRMGQKLAQLAAHLYDHPLLQRWLNEIARGAVPGTYPVCQGLLFARAGLSGRALFFAHQYGVVNMVLGAALRCVRVSHYDTQRILYRLGGELPSLYAHVSRLTPDDMCAFSPQLDILASLHEKGDMRMFMN